MLFPVCVRLWVGYLLYGLTLPFQMFTHSYYHIQLIPIVALGLAAALNPLLESAAGQGAVGRVGFIAVIVAVIGFQAWVSCTRASGSVAGRFAR